MPPPTDTRRNIQLLAKLLTGKFVFPGTDNVAVIGLGRFGRSVAQSLTELGHDVMGIDKKEERVQSLTDVLTHTVQADSTAWARQLQNMRSQILTEIIRRFPDAGVESVRFIGPDVPSWKWGPRAVPGRGPRDTYG